MSYTQTFSYTNEVVGSHTIHHGIIGCMDFRLRESRQAFMAEQGISHYDNCVMPGAVKNYLEGDDGCVQLSLAIQVITQLHEGDTVWLFQHTDCGAYGGSVTFDSLEEELRFQEGQLLSAREKIEGECQAHGHKVPMIRLFIEHINKEKQAVEYIEVQD